MCQSEYLCVFVGHSVYDGAVPNGLKGGVFSLFVYSLQSAKERSPVYVYYYQRSTYSHRRRVAGLAFETINVYVKIHKHWRNLRPLVCGPRAAHTDEYLKTLQHQH